MFTNLVTGAELIAGEKADEVESERRNSRIRVLASVLRTNRVIEKLRDAGIAVIVMKGPATGVTGYDDPSLRPFSDADFLVKPEDVGAAVRVVRDLGFEPLYDKSDEAALLRAGHALELMSDTFKVELHTELLSRYLRVPFDNDAVWASSRTVRCGGEDIEVLAPEVEFLFLCAHGAKHEWFKYRWICDIAQLVPRLTDSDIERLIELSHELNARKILSLALQLARDTFDLALPLPLEAARTAYDTGKMSRTILGNVGVDQVVATRGMSWMSRISPAMPLLAFWMSTRERLRDRIMSAADLALNRYK